MIAVGLEPCTACPAWIIKCAHLGDRTAWLFTWTGQEGSIAAGEKGWGTLIRIRSESPTVWENVQHHSSLAEAEAEFARRDALLRTEP